MEDTPEIKAAKEALAKAKAAQDASPGGWNANNYNDALFKLQRLQEAQNTANLRQSVQTPGAAANFMGQNAFGASNLNLPGMQLGNQDQSRLQQAQVIQALQAQAAGSKDTLGQQQLQQGFGQAAAQQRSLGSSIRGAGGGAGLRAGTLGAADTQRGFAGQSEMLKLQEQQAAQAMLAQLLAQQHAQDVGLAGSMASGSLANQQLNQDMERFYSGEAMKDLAGRYQRGSDFEAAMLGQRLDARNLEDRFRNQLMGAGAGGLGALQKISTGFGSSSSQPTDYRQVDGQNSIVPIDEK